MIHLNWTLPQLAFLKKMADYRTKTHNVAEAFYLTADFYFRLCSMNNILYKLLLFYGVYKIVSIFRSIK